MTVRSLKFLNLKNSKEKGKCDGNTEDITFIISDNMCRLRELFKETPGFSCHIHGIQPCYGHHLADSGLHPCRRCRYLQDPL